MSKKFKDMDCTTKYGRAFYNGKEAKEVIIGAHHDKKELTKEQKEKALKSGAFIKEKLFPKPQYKNTPGSTLTHNHIKEMDRDNRRRDEGRII